MKETKITFLGPVGATFSHDAYEVLSKKYGAPQISIETETENCLPAKTNSDVLPIIIAHGGYGALAVETLAEGRVSEPLESFVKLLADYDSSEECPIKVIGAEKIKLHFCLMSKDASQKPEKIIAHTKALGACKNNVVKITDNIEAVSSNGEAARLVAESKEHSDSAAIAPKSAAQKYGLQIINDRFEDAEAITTFFLIGPKSHREKVGQQNRMLIVYRLAHKPGALLHSLVPFYEENLNLIQIHSVHTGNHTYDFAIELDVSETEIESAKRSTQKFGKEVQKFLVFGPFEVLS